MGLSLLLECKADLGRQATAKTGRTHATHAFDVAVVCLERGTWLTEAGRTDEGTPLLDEARQIFERLVAAQSPDPLRGPDAMHEPAAID